MVGYRETVGVFVGAHEGSSCLDSKGGRQMDELDGRSFEQVDLCLNWARRVSVVMRQWELVLVVEEDEVAATQKRRFAMTNDPD